MGDPSGLRFVPASSSATPIDWTRIPEKTKKLLIKLYGYDWEKDEHKPIPTTIGDLAQMFDESKFFGYLGPDILTILMDISKFGLKPQRTQSGRTLVGPRFYMTYIDQVWFFLFAPGTRDCVLGHSDNIIRNDHDYDKWAADETAMAQAFDVTLEEDVSRGMDKAVKFVKKLGGWTAMTSQSSLEYAQYAEAIMMLPGSHPAHRALMEDAFRPLYDKK